MGIAAAVIQLLAYWLYYRAAKRGEILPNVSAWIMALIINLGQAAIYADLTEFDLTDNLLQIVCTIFSLVIVLLALKQHNKLKDLNWIDVLALLINIGAVGAWLHYRSPEWGSVIMGIADVASFVPIFFTTWHMPKRERATPWIWWGIAYGLLTTATLIDHDYWESVFPAINLLLHFAIAVLAVRKRSSAK